MDGVRRVSEGFWRYSSIVGIFTGSSFAGAAVEGLWWGEQAGQTSIKKPRPVTSLHFHSCTADTLLMQLRKQPDLPSHRVSL